MALKCSALLLSLNLLFFTFLTSIPSSSATLVGCPPDALKLGVCVDVLNVLTLKVGSVPPNSECCSLIGNLIKLDAAACLCTSLQLNVLNVLKLTIPNLDLQVLLNYCKAPTGFKCS